MRLKEIAGRFKKCKVTLLVQRALSSFYFPLVTAALALICYYTGCDLLFIWYLLLSGAAILLFCDDITPVFVIVLFMNVMLSMKHSPTYSSDPNYFFRPAILAQEITGGVILAGTAFFRFISVIVQRKFKPTPLFWSMVVMSVGFMLGGLFYTKYTPYNLIYGFYYSFPLVGAFVVMSGCIRRKEDTFCKLAVYLISFFAVVATELIVAYSTYDNLIVGGEVVRSRLVFGWGTYNHLGFFLIIALPAWFYLSLKYKYGGFFLIGAAFNLATCFFSMSRQAILMSGIVFAACCVWLFICEKGKKRIIDVCAVAAVGLTAAILLIAFRKELSRFFAYALWSLETGSGRRLLWEQGVQNFLKKPLFGVGWYDLAAGNKDLGYFNPGNPSGLPIMAHNTIIQLMSSCGLVGLIPYLIHRAQTVVEVIKKPDKEKVFIGLTICTILLVCLLDLHIFRIFPSIMYSMLLAFLTVGENGGKSEKQPIKLSTL